MNGLNKFKMFTIIFICMFVFVVGAIYTNTKEVSENKTQANKQAQNDSAPKTPNVNQNMQGNEQINDLYWKVDELSRKVEEISNNSSEGTSLSCNVQGVLDGDKIEELTSDAALQEARDNGRELVLICSF